MLYYIILLYNMQSQITKYNKQIDILEDKLYKSYSPQWIGRYKKQISLIQNKLNQIPLYNQQQQRIAQRLQQYEERERAKEQRRSEGVRKAQETRRRNKEIRRVNQFNKIKSLINLRNRGKKVLINGSLILTITDALINSLRGDIIEDEEFFDETSKKVFYLINEVKINSIELITNENKKQRRKGGYFNYLLKSTDKEIINRASKYGIFNFVNKEYLNYANCLYYALKLGGLSTVQLEQVKLLLNELNIYTKSLKQISQILGITLKLHKIDKLYNKVQTTTFNKGFKEFHICLYDKHYMFYETINQVNTLRFVESLFKNNLLEPIKENLILLPHINKNIKYDKLEYLDNQVVLFENKGIKEQQRDIIYFDYEATTNTKEHKEYCLSYCVNNRPTVSYMHEDMTKTFLNKLILLNKPLCYAHNLKYDFGFISSKVDKIINSIQRGGRYLSITVKYKNKLIEFRDTMNWFNGSLKNFCISMNVKNKDLWNHNMINDYEPTFNNVDELVNKYYKQDEEEFKANWNNILTKYDYCDVREYTIFYNKQDVNCLRECMNSFNEKIKSMTNLDIHNIMTISSLSTKYIQNNNCYDGIYQLGGIPRHFIQKCVYGGRVLTRENKKIKVDNEVSVLDVNSLYPSAMAQFKGFIKGKPKPFYNEIPTNNDYYYVKVKVINSTKSYPMPLTVVNRKYDNVKKDDILYVGKDNLEDLVKYLGLTYKVISGYYFNDGFNDNICNLIKQLYEQRLNYKKLGNKPMTDVVKLILNSIYGKTLMKPEEYDTSYFNNYDNLIKNINYNEGEIKAVKFGHTWKLQRKKNILNHFNYCHLGAYVLDYSKKIMNNFICSMEDNNIKVYYQDTDSIHIDKSNLEKLNKDWLSNDKLGCLKEEDYGINSKTAYYLGKKSYYILSLKNLVEKKELIRMKGIPQDCFNKVKFDNKYINYDVQEVYKRLYEGQTATFDLINSKSIEFIGFTPSTRDKFIRSVSF